MAKPSCTPDPATISMIWMIFYPVIFISFGFVFVQSFRSMLPGEWLPFAVNLVANLLFMPIFAGLRNVSLAAVDIVITVGHARLVHGRRRAALPLGRPRPNALPRVGVHRFRSITAMNW